MYKVSLQWITDNFSCSAVVRLNLSFLLNILPHPNCEIYIVFTSCQRQTSALTSMTQMWSQWHHEWHCSICDFCAELSNFSVQQKQLWFGHMCHLGCFFTWLVYRIAARCASIWNAYFCMNMYIFQHYSEIIFHLNCLQNHFFKAFDTYKCIACFQTSTHYRTRRIQRTWHTLE